MEPRLIKRTIDLLAEEWRTRGWRQRLMLTGAVLADKLELSVWCGDEPASLEGAAATAFFETEKLEVKKPCEITANTICVEFPAEAYVEGRLVVRIYIADTVRSIPLYMETFEVGQGHGTVVYDPENIVDITMVTALLASINQKLDKGGHAPNKYLGTDSDGNVVEKDAPSGGGGITGDYVSAVNGQTGDVNLKASDVGADPAGTAAADVAAHDTRQDAHNDIRLALQQLAKRLNAALDSDDDTLDELSEIVAYIKSNKTILDAITISKVNVSDIVNNLTTNVVNKPLSAAQGVVLKALIDAITVPTNVSQLTNDAGYLTHHQDISGKLDANKLPEAVNEALAQAAASGEFDGVGIEGVTVTRSPDEYGYYYITVTLTNGQQQAFPYRNGVDGQRGTGILNITSGLTSYTTTINGLKPAYRILLSDAISQSQVSEILVGDSFRYSNYIYPVIAVDDTYAYCSTRVTIKGGNGTSVTHSWDGTVLTVTSASGTSSADLRGPAGSDANVTTANITNALGYSPADADTVNQLASEIGAIPDYVETEAKSVIERVLAAQGKRTLTIAAISDLHYASSYTDGILHACQALKYIDERIKLDALAVLGDYTDGYTTRDLADALADYRAINALMGQLRFAPNLRQMGNHDYYENNIPITRRFVQMYSDDVVWGDRHGGYYYKDFDMFKARVICLNCNENNVMETDSSTGGVKPTGSISITAAQAQWFADMLADVNTKTDADEWQVLVLSHQPLDWYDSQTGYTLPKIVNAYHEGTSYSNSVVTCNYTGKNLAKLICNIHGHIHNFLVDYIHKDNVANGNKTKVWRMATPQACLNRANEYQGAWHEATTYEKTQNTVKDTSFVIYCIDLDTCTIRAICYGAGYDRTLVYHTETVVYNITQTLTNVTSSNTAINIAQGEAFTTTLTAQSGYEIGTIKVTMGGADVTASALSGSKITINSVTGDIVITATATLIQTGPAYTNQIPISVAQTGGVFDGDGIKADTRLNSSGAEATLAGTAVTGYIPIKWNDVVRFKNINYKPSVNSTGNYIALYKPDFTNIMSSKDGTMTDSTLTYMFADRVKDADGRLIQFRLADGSQDFGYMRVSAAGLNADSIITINEEITD